MLATVSVPLPPSATVVPLPTAAQPYALHNELKLDSVAENEALIQGLLASRATLSPKYFYDDLGCALYEAITRLPEYYPTRTEMAIFEQYRQAIAMVIGQGKQFVDLGSGDSLKASGWFSSIKPVRYVAVDIAESVIRSSLGRIAREQPGMELVGLVTDFSKRIELSSVLADQPTTFFYPGSSIGNFSPEEAEHFVSQIREHCKRDGDGLLIGVDCKKSKVRLDLAYDDPLGVTAAFNLNALRHVNRLIDADFDIGLWKHRGFYNAALGRIEMHLEAKQKHRVRLGAGLGKPQREFNAGDRIHSENSYKYHPGEFQALLKAGGFSHAQCWQDPAGDFSVWYTMP